MTGAMIPEGADAVVPIERALPSTFPNPEAEDVDVLLPATTPGTYVRHIGSDISEGDGLPAGTFLGPAQLGLLAALGLTSAEVRKPMRVLLVTTGDEVLEPGQSLTPRKIYDSNGTLPEASMRQSGLDVVRTGISDDDPARLRAVLNRHLASEDGQHRVDLIVTTGGVSKGAYEVVRQAMAGQHVDFLPVAMQPGGPQGIGRFEGVPFLGFPGNPVSCLVSYEMFLRPALSQIHGAPHRDRYSGRAWRNRCIRPRASIKSAAERCCLTAPSEWRVAQEATVHALARSNALVHIPSDVTELAEEAKWKYGCCE